MPEAKISLKTNKQKSVRKLSVIFNAVSFRLIVLFDFRGHHKAEAVE